MSGGPVVASCGLLSLLGVTDADQGEKEIMVGRLVKKMMAEQKADQGQYQLKA